MPWRPNPRDLDRWLPLPNSQTGSRVEIMFRSNGDRLVRYTIAEEVTEELKKNATANRELLRKGRLLGNTQRHWLKIGSYPAELYQQAKAAAGGETEGLKRRLFNHRDFRAFRSSEHEV